MHLPDLFIQDNVVFFVATDFGKTIVMFYYYRRVYDPDSATAETCSRSCVLEFEGNPKKRPITILQ